MQGSPFGNSFTGNLVRHTPSIGFGIKGDNNLYADISWVRTITTENYFLFTTIDSHTKINYKNTMIALTIGYKFFN
jgi:hypothetical protein